MATRGFKAKEEQPKVRPDGTKERVELSEQHGALKKYFDKEGRRKFTDVQAPGESHADFYARVKKKDVLAGFRALFKDSDARAEDAQSEVDAAQDAAGLWSAKYTRTFKINFF